MKIGMSIGVKTPSSLRAPPLGIDLFSSSEGGAWWTPLNITSVNGSTANSTGIVTTAGTLTVLNNTTWVIT